MKNSVVMVFGGLITATLLTLLALPTIYHWMEKNRSIPLVVDDERLFGREDKNNTNDDSQYLIRDL